MGLNFYYCDGLQPKMSAGIINAHECTWPGWVDNDKSFGYLSLVKTGW